MAIKELVHDEAVLSTPCEKATAEDAQVAQDLLDTMASLDEAACLHANQIGVTHNLFAYVDEKDKQHVMFNPVIKLGLAASKQVEGCFTHEEPVTVTRYDRIKVSYEELVDGKLVPPQGRLPRLGRAADPAHGRPRQGQVHLSAYEPKGTPLRLVFFCVFCAAFPIAAFSISLLQAAKMESIPWNAGISDEDGFKSISRSISRFAGSGSMSRPCATGCLRRSAQLLLQIGAFL